MISTARLLSRSASYGELGSFVLMSLVPVFLIGVVGYLLTMAVPELAGAQPGLHGAYLVKVFDAVWPVLYALVGVFVAFKNYRTLQDTVARCELAEDELAWIKRCSEYGRMGEDRELMRLAVNARRVCQTYHSQHPLFERFLGEYLRLLENYGSGMEKTTQARIQYMKEAADEGLEQHARRVRREQMKKNREES